ncbi:hypothetical protein [Halomonas jincaotanensis]|uniref:hypothetical protein n=1 Tax=Halomonas jincaotanensis TaxID=2810616 RepID=UPI003872CD7E
MAVDWFYIVQTFTKALAEFRKKERREKGHPKPLRWSVLKRVDNDNMGGHATGGTPGTGGRSWGHR